ncbi:MAG: hypothetical protein NT001_05400 [Candidatus Woesearchaeota archaeon]|nr:hypothetical protein [Candidatus Woesearchaeota archaeon]
METKDLIKKFTELLTKHIQNVPNGFYDKFEYTQTGNNKTHPRTLGFIVKTLSELGIDLIDIDSKLNEKGIKFQPDLIGRDFNEKERIIIDYESPNSSDARIIEKDIEPYLKWVECTKKRDVPYIIITTLPDKESQKWELKYTSKGYYNEKHKGKKADVQKNPFRYWHNVYEEEIKSKGIKSGSIYLVNINGKKVESMQLT